MASTEDLNVNSEYLHAMLIESLEDNLVLVWADKHTALILNTDRAILGCIASNCAYICLSEGSQPTVLQYRTLKAETGNLHVVSISKLWDLIDSIRKKLTTTLSD